MTEVHPVTVVGLDLSLSSTGVAVARSDLSVSTERIQPPAKLRDCERMAWMTARISEFTKAATMVVLEGPSMKSKFGHPHERAGLWWLVRYGLWRAGVPVAVSPPFNLKKYATGTTRVEKEQVLVAAVRRFPEWEGDGNDEADALWLAAMGAAKLGFPLVKLPATHRDALVKVSWPDLDLLDLLPARVVRSAD